MMKPFGATFAGVRNHRVVWSICAKIDGGRHLVRRDSWRDNRVRRWLWGSRSDVERKPLQAASLVHRRGFLFFHCAYSQTDESKNWCKICRKLFHHLFGPANFTFIPLKLIQIT